MEALPHLARLHKPAGQVPRGEPQLTPEPRGLLPLGACSGIVCVCVCVSECKCRFCPSVYLYLASDRRTHLRAARRGRRWGSPRGATAWAAPASSLCEQSGERKERGLVPPCILSGTSLRGGLNTVAKAQDRRRIGNPPTVLGRISRLGGRQPLVAASTARLGRDLKRGRLAPITVRPACRGRGRRCR